MSSVMMRTTLGRRSGCCAFAWTGSAASVQHIRTANVWAMRTFAEAMARRESRVVGWVRRGTIVIACVYAVSFSWSIYRRINQILRIEAHATSLVLAPG